MSEMREKLLAELHIWEKEAFTLELYSYIENEIQRTQDLVFVATRNKDYEEAHQHIGYLDALTIVRNFGREWVEENSDE